MLAAVGESARACHQPPVVSACLPGALPWFLPSYASQFISFFLVNTGTTYFRSKGLRPEDLRATLCLLSYAKVCALEDASQAGGEGDDAPTPDDVLARVQQAIAS